MTKYEREELLMFLAGVAIVLLWLGLTALSFYFSGTEWGITTFLALPAGMAFGRVIS